MSDNIINFGTETSEELEERVLYDVTYKDLNNDVTSEVFEGDAVMTNSFVGFATGDQILRFAIPLDRLLSIRLIENTNTNSVQ